ncbi:tetratricopeptide repeat protein [Tenuifilum thalassicum]|uniref:Tetratricopeptide repeat protein n=1 Tax=Tenuifilum thalassicum TaxID=2590900 RepID=A0A7D4CH98_9BACT|nr:tetratricopeptide repeat protein [Tenuifilum thalassicum]QKG80386.1 tetratricopeptide repeat protein [Tenuifilum thalassicum]
MGKKTAFCVQFLLSTLLTLSVLFTIAQTSNYSRPDFEKDSVFASQLFNQIENLYFDNQDDSCLLLINKALPFFDKLNLTNYKILSLGYRGAINRYLGNFKDALSDLSKVLNYYEQIGNQKGQASVLNQIGAIYRQRGDYPTALDYYFKSLYQYQKINYKRGISSVLNNIGVVHMYQKLYDKALEYYEMSLVIEEELENDDGMATSYLNIGEIYKKKGNLDKASDYYLKALIYSNKTNDLDAIGTIYNELAGINIERGNLTDAPRYLNLARETFLKTKSPIRIAESEINFGKYYLQIGNLNQATKHFSSALDIADKNNLLEISSNAHRYLNRIYEKLNNIPLAYKHFKKYIETRDSIFNEENTRKSLQAEFFYKFEQQQEQHRIEQAKKKTEYQQKLKRDRTIRNFLIAIISLSGLFIGLILFSLRKIEHKNKELAERQNEILEKNEELLQQQEEILAQRDEIERKNLILEQTQQILADKNERMISSIEYAKTIQSALLPKPEQLDKIFNDYFIIFQPKDIVSGDFYWVSNDSQYTYAAVMDCTGHGVPGAFMSMIGNTLLNKIVNEWKINTPSKILELLNDQLREALKQKTGKNIVLAGIDIAFVTIDRKNKKIAFSGAARPLLIIQNGVMNLVKGNIRSTGGFQPAKLKPYEDVTFDILSPTYLYLFSDGYVDQISADKKKFGIKRFTEIIELSYTKPMKVQQELLNQLMEGHLHGADQIDDICILGLRID